MGITQGYLKNGKEASVAGDWWKLGVQLCI